jgi:hypothetical protein
LIDFNGVPLFNSALLELDLDMPRHPFRYFLLPTVVHILSATKTQAFLSSYVSLCPAHPQYPLAFPDKDIFFLIRCFWSISIRILYSGMQFWGQVWPGTPTGSFVHIPSAAKTKGFRSSSYISLCAGHPQHHPLNRSSLVHSPSATKTRISQWYPLCDRFQQESSIPLLGFKICLGTLKGNFVHVPSATGLPQ